MPKNHEEIPPQYQNGDRAVMKWLMKILSGVAVAALSAGIIWLISTTHATATSVSEINVTLRVMEKQLDGLPKEFPPSEYRHEMDTRLGWIESMIGQNYMMLRSQSTNVIRTAR